MTMKTFRLAAGVGALLFAFVLTGCDKTIDTGDLEGKIGTSIRSTSGNLDGVKVTCPDDIVAKQGKTFTCTATAPGGSKVNLTVTLLDNEGKFSYKAAGPVTSTAPPATTTPATTTPATTTPATTTPVTPPATTTPVTPPTTRTTPATPPTTRTTP